MDNWPFLCHTVILIHNLKAISQERVSSLFNCNFDSDVSKRPQVTTTELIYSICECGSAFLHQYINKQGQTKNCHIDSFLEPLMQDVFKPH